MFELLKKATLTEHTELEKVLILKLKNISEQNDYLKILSSMYGFYKPLEQEIQKQVDESVLPDIRKRQRTGYLLSDIETLDRSASRDLRFAQVPRLDSMSEALGALYVLEGSTLGGQIITQMLQKNPALPQKEATRYFNGYGEHTHTMWGEFKRQVLASQTAVQESELITGASKTFKAFHNWLTQN